MKESNKTSPFLSFFRWKIVEVKTKSYVFLRHLAFIFVMLIYANQNNVTSQQGLLLAGNTDLPFVLFCCCNVLSSLWL